MPSARQVTVDASNNDPRGLGRSGDRSTLRAAYASSPIYRNDLTVETVRSSFERGTGLDTGEFSGNPMFGTLRRNFQDSPDLSTVATGGGGLPGTPFSPNVASPGEGNGLVASSIPASGAEAAANAPHGGGFGVGNGRSSPSETAPRVVRRIGDPLQLGRRTSGV